MDVFIIVSHISFTQLLESILYLLRQSNKSNVSACNTRGKSRMLSNLYFDSNK